MTDCKCIKTDDHGETDCRFASADVMLGCFVCDHECVKSLNQKISEQQLEIWRLNSIIRSYRKAFTPFLGMCREVVKAAEDFEKEAGNE